MLLLSACSVATARAKQLAGARSGSVLVAGSTQLRRSKVLTQLLSSEAVLSEKQAFSAWRLYVSSKETTANARVIEQYHKNPMPWPPNPLQSPFL